jgi:hypothetical protein
MGRTQVIRANGLKNKVALGEEPAGGSDGSEIAISLTGNSLAVSSAG